MEIYTTGKVAKLLKVAPRTVAKWIDSGRLVAYVLPMTRHRRVTKASLVAFMQKHGMPLALIQEEPCTHST